MDRSLRPYTCYKQLLVASAREHGISIDYIDQIDHIKAITDPDAARRAMYEPILAPIENAPRSWIAEL